MHRHNVGIAASRCSNNNNFSKILKAKLKFCSAVFTTVDKLLKYNISNTNKSKKMKQNVANFNDETDFVKYITLTECCNTLFVL